MPYSSVSLILFVSCIVRHMHHTILGPSIQRQSKRGPARPLGCCLLESRDKPPLPLPSPSQLFKPDHLAVSDNAEDRTLRDGRSLKKKRKKSLSPERLWPQSRHSYNAMLAAFAVTSNSSHILKVTFYFLGTPFTVIKRVKDTQHAVLG